MAATIKDISAKANVSIATVSKVLNGDYSKVSVKTKERILKIADELDYRPNMLARGLASQKFSMVGVIIPDISNPYYGEMVRGMIDEATLYDFRVMISNTDNLHQRQLSAIQTMAEYNAAGIVLVGGGENIDSILEMIKRIRIPYVLTEIHGNNIDYSVYVDDFGGSYNATTHFIASGHKNIAYISGFPSPNHPNDQRGLGYTAALEKHQIAVSPFLFESGSFTFEAGYKATIRLLNRNMPFTAILCGNDLIAMGALKAIKEHHLKVPDDISLIGFDDVYLSTIVEPNLTSVHQPAYEIGMSSIQMLMSRIEKKPLKEKSKCFKPILIQRDTVVPPKNNG
ncbi:MAG: LacI family transcriptional regulator [Clostridiales bacterium]|nr:LacI family transcriptional regulator [Clostridiales bacterium]